jgi:branched-chain amino acid transport system permease protein
MQLPKIISYLVVITMLLALGPYILLDAKSLFFHYAMVYVYLLLIAIAWNYLYTLTGMVSLGLQLYFGVAAYATALFINLTSNVAIAVAASFLISTLLSLAVSLLLIRLRGLSFTIGSWMFAEGTLLIMLNVPGMGGSQGYGVPLIQIPVKELYAASLSAIVFILLATYILSNGKLGFGARGVKYSEQLAGTLGLNVPLYKVMVLTICHLIAALAGILYMLYVKYTDPYTAFSIMWSIEAIIISVIGGINTLLGPFVGGAVYLVIHEYVRFLYAELNILITGAIMVFFGVAYKEGIMGFVNKMVFQRIVQPVKRQDKPV